MLKGKIFRIRMMKQPNPHINNNTILNVEMTPQTIKEDNISKLMNMPLKKECKS